MTGRPSVPEIESPRARPPRSRLRDARIRSKLGLLLIIPLVAVLVLAAIRLVDGGQRAVSVEMLRSLAVVSAQASELSHELHRERMTAARLLTDDDRDPSAFNRQAARTDQAINQYYDAREALGRTPATVSDRLAQVDGQLQTLSIIRQDVLRGGDVTVSAAGLRYGVILSDILAYQEALGQVAGDVQLAESIRAVAALSKVKHHMAESHAVAYLGLAGGSLGQESVTSFFGARTGQQEALLAFTLAASPEQLALLNNALTGDAMVAAERAANDVVRAAGDRPQISADEADRALGAVTNLVVRAELQLHDGQVALVTDLRDSVRQQVLLEAGVVLATLVIAVVLALLLAGMLARSLGQLREGALTVANRDLPETVARFSDPQVLGDHTPAEIASQVRDPIQLHSRDEVGEVAQAFNVVHQAAVKVAAEQAALRTSVSAMFLSLARRSQTLVDRIINELDDIERNEEDPKRLARLFALDHLATRMRRNDENLLVLAGADSGPSRAEDALVADVLRAAQSEIEHYDRIEFGTVDGDVSVTALAVNDVVRLVAELFDNATRFSPPDSPAVAEARRLGDQVIIQVEDRGVGMPQEQANQLNAWLAAPPAIDVTTFRRMGLAVVARLATRHGIRVELRSDQRSGTVVYVALPPSILILPQYRSRTAEIPLPRTPLPTERAPAPPPLPARHLGQLPRRSAEVVTHSARRRTNEPAEADQNPGVRLDQPVAGRPPEGLMTRSVGHPQHTTAAPASADHTVELPIFREMEAVWFRSHGSLDLGASVPDATAATTDRGAQASWNAHTAPTPTTSTANAAGAAGSGDQSASTDWRTAADDGWNAAAKAAEPPVAGATRSGLPKRVPQAQLVPGGVETPTEPPAPTQRRSPDEVRGLLSAYHRGVQRGREHWGR